MKNQWIDKWIAVPDELARQYAHKIYQDKDGYERFDNTLDRGGFNGRIVFLRLRDLSKVYFNGWLRIDCVQFDNYSEVVEYFVFKDLGKLSWKRVEGYEAKSLDELLSKMDADGALFDEPSTI